MSPYETPARTPLGLSARRRRKFDLPLRVSRTVMFQPPPPLGGVSWNTEPTYEPGRSQLVLVPPVGVTTYGAPLARTRGVPFQ